MSAAPDRLKLRLAYGSDGLEVSLPAGPTAVIVPRYPEALPDPHAALAAAIARPVAGPPLQALLTPGQRVAISICDGTRPQPRRIVLPALLDALAGAVGLDHVVVLLATGTHRGNTPAELRAMLGDELVEAVTIVNHDARDPASLAWVGRLGDDVPVWLNRHWLEADIRITTGVVEPHFFAGFSGGPKMVAPGLAALETVLTLHDARRIGDPNARFGVTEGNPVHDDVRAIAAATGVDFCLDVVLDGSKQITHVFAGELFEVHRRACAVARETVMCPVPAPFDVVLTTNSGFPLDQNLYQAVKGLAAAAQVVKPGGTIVCAAECRDGFPEHGEYRRQLCDAASPQALVEQIAARTVTLPDQWQLQIQAAIQSRSRVVMHTSYLSDAELAAAHLEQTADIEATIAAALDAAGPQARLCVLPDGPQTVPYLSS